MEDELGANDPYRGMDSGEQEIRPDFLTGKDNPARKVLSAAEQAASIKGGKGKTGDKGGVGSANAKTGKAKNSRNGADKTSSIQKASAAEEGQGGLYNSQRTTKNGDSKGDNNDFRMSSAVKAMAPVLLILLAIVIIIGVMIALPIIMIGAIDYNLQKSLGFDNTVGILEEQGEYVTAELAASGKFPSKYSEDLAQNGIDVGQVTANGDFIKTDTYIANIEEKEGLVAAATGFSYSSDREGELALLYDGDLISADEFVARVESEPKLYAAYSEAANLSVKYYYGKDVSKVYKQMRLSRGSFNDWEATGDYKTDEESYLKILKSVLDGKRSNLELGGIHQDEAPTWGDAFPAMAAWFSLDGPGSFREDVSEGDAEDITKSISEQTKSYINGWYLDTCERTVTDENGNPKTETFTCQKPQYDDTQTKRAAELLNTAVSSAEPYLASSAFLGVEEPIQRARIGDNGPINQVMNTLSTPTEVTYRDVATGKTVTKNLSIFETVNFQAAVGEKPYSTEEASSFARDRVLEVTGQADTDIIKRTTISSNGKKNSSSVVRNGNHSSADYDTISKANDSVSFAISRKNSDLFESVVGGNRIVEGGSFLSNNINMKVIGAMPSDAGTVAAYQKEVDEVMARKAEADRATLSPFDISSPNTFLGGIVHKFATALVGVFGRNSTSMLSTMDATGSVASDAAMDILGTVSAEGSEQKYTTLSPDNCETVGAIAVEGDLYCTSHNTVNTDYMSYTLDDWKDSDIGSSINGDGKIVEESDLEKFVVMGMDRESTVGTMNAEVCSSWHSYNDGFFEKATHFFQQMLGLYQVCNGVEAGIADGSKYSFTNGQDSKLGLYSGYMLHNQVYSLLSDEDSSVAVLRERYYAEHPQDDSEAGMIARISGLTRGEAEIALEYANYLNVIASYDASSRYSFGDVLSVLEIEQPILKSHSNKIAGEILAWQTKETEFNDMRSRQVVTG